MPTLQEIKKRQQYITKANQIEEKYGLPKNLLVGVMGAESNFNPNAVSPVGAKGLMQFMKATAQEYGINPLNPSESIDAAGKYLASSYKKFGNWEDSLRSYNMGVGGLQKVKAGKMKMPKETQDYVGRVYKNAGIKYEEPSYANSVAPYVNQPTPTINNLQIPQQNTTFASVPDSVEKEETKTEEDKDVAEVEQKTKEFNFLDEVNTTASFFKPREMQQIEAPQTDYMQQYEQISQFIENPQVAQQGKKFKLQDERNLVVRDNTPNTKRDLSLMLAEYNNAKKDEQELRTTGQIKNPNSIQYRRNIKTQPDIKQDNISTEQRNAPLNPLQRPLIYLANPEKVLGDLGVSGMETSELDRQKVNANRFNPYQSRTDRFINNAKIGLEYVPEATVNTAMAAAFMPEGAGGLGLVNEALNPLAGIKTSIPDELRQGLNSQGFLDMFKKAKPEFKSEINWGEWNKEIPENTQLIKEYNTIEQQAKANNTWMKNPDGSTFQGTPEQFVQQNSQNFKKAYPEGYKTVYRGMPYDNPLLLQKENFTGVFTGDKNLAKGYGSNLYELGLKNSNNSISFNANGDDWLDLRFANRDVVTQQKNIDFNKKYLNDLITKEGNSERVVNMKENILRSEKALRENKNALNNQKYQKLTNSFKDESVVITDDIAQYLEKEKLDNIQINNVLDGEFGDINISNQVPGNYLKSLKGNNGMFDMNNPNIYKSIVPLAGASYLATQGQEQNPPQYQQGGNFTENELAFLSEIAIKDNNGYWNPKNQGRVVEIEGGNISMEGVNQDLIGIGIKNGKKTEQKIMKTNKNYNFKNVDKVLEIPFFKK